MLKISTLVVALGLVLSTGCKKKEGADSSGGNAKTTEGSATMTGSDPAKMADPAKPDPAKPDPAKPDPAAMKPAGGTDLVELYKKCNGELNDGKLDDFKKDCVADSYVMHPIGVGEDKKGPDALVSFMTDMKTAFPDGKHTPQLILVNGKNVFAVNLITGTHEGTLKTPMGEVPATHKKIGVLMFHRLAFDDSNKVTEEWGIADTMTMMSQMGLAPKEAPPMRAAMDKGVDAPVVAVAADDAKEKANLEAFKKSNDAFSAHKYADIAALMTDDAVESDQAEGQDTKGKAEIEKGAKMFGDAFSDGKLTNVTTWAAGDFVVGIGKLEGTNDHDMGKMKKTGKKVSIDYVEIAQLKDGKTAQLWRFRSNMQFAMQMGLMPEHKAGDAPKGDAPKGEAPKGEAPKGETKTEPKTPAKK